VNLFGGSGNIASQATLFFSTTFGLLGNLLLLIASALYLAASSRTYASGLVALVPPARRPRAEQVLMRARRFAFAGPCPLSSPSCATVSWMTLPPRRTDRTRRQYVCVLLPLRIFECRKYIHTPLSANTLSSDVQLRQGGADGVPQVGAGHGEGALVDGMRGWGGRGGGA